MNALKIIATIDGSLFELEAKQTDPLHPHFEIIHEGKRIAAVRKENGKWLIDEEDSLMPAELDVIGKAIDEQIQHQY